MNTQDELYLKKLLRHVESVRIDCEVIGQALLSNGETADGLSLIANGRSHDSSKFHGLEWEHLRCKDDPLFAEALAHHHACNAHHPEFHSSIHEMNRILVFEMVCDWKARANLFDQTIHEYIETQARQRYEFSERDEVSREVVYGMEMLLEESFAYKKSG